MDVTNAVTVESKVEVKWAGMGTLFAVASSRQQSAFLVSMAQEMKTWGVNNQHFQMRNIAECLDDDTKSVLKELFPILWDEEES